MIGGQDERCRVQEASTEAQAQSAEHGGCIAPASQADHSLRERGVACALQHRAGAEEWLSQAEGRVRGGTMAEQVTYEIQRVKNTVINLDGWRIVSSKGDVLLPFPTRRAAE